jgi:hypothetical protein
MYIEMFSTDSTQFSLYFLARVLKNLQHPAYRLIVTYCDCAMVETEAPIFHLYCSFIFLCDESTRG